MVAPRQNDSTLTAAHIGKSVVIKGELSGSESVYLDGRVEGTIDLRGQTLTIGPNGKVKANVQARVIVVQGELEGDLTATERVDLRHTASVHGKIVTQRISLEDGAFLKGSVDIQGRAEPVGPPPQAKAMAAAAPIPAK